MIALAPNDHQDLRRLVAAGQEGLPVGEAFPLSLAVRLKENGFAVLAENGNAIQARATSRGGVFAYRTAT